MDVVQDASPGPEDKDENQTAGNVNAQGARARSADRQNLETSRALSASVGSLDRRFETHSSDKPSIPFPSGPPLTAAEKSFIEETHGFDEIRDGFFEAVFLCPEDVIANAPALMEHAEQTLPLSFKQNDPLSISYFFPTRYYAMRNAIRRVTTTRSGIELVKSFLGFFIAYAICLIPVVQQKFGRYAYIMAISAIMNHPGRTVGAQVDGTVLTILGTATGLGWGAFGLWLSTVTTPARAGFAAILALFLFIFMFIIACLRSYYIRTYQLVICAGIAISYACLADVSAEHVSWPKLLDYGKPWLIGQAVSLVVCVLIFPDTGSRLLATGIHQTFDVMVEAIPPVGNHLKTRRRLAQAFVDMSQVYRDLVIDFSITKLNPRDALMLRNLIQEAIRALSSLRRDSRLSRPLIGNIYEGDGSSSEEGPDFVANIGARNERPNETEQTRAVAYVTESLTEPMKRLLHSMKFALKSCDAALMEMCGHRRSLGLPSDISNDVHSASVSLQEHITAFCDIQEMILCSDKLPLACFKHPDIIKIFAYCRPVHQAATAIQSLATELIGLQQRLPKHRHFHLPSYPLRKAIHRTNAQVRHDRGGVTAGSYFRNLSDVTKIIQTIGSRDFRPVSQRGVDGSNATASEKTTAGDFGNRPSYGNLYRRCLYKIWTGLHRMQGFETRFGLKTALVTFLLSLPAYFLQSRSWWDRHQAWWAVVMSWLIMGPRTGGNVQDLFTRVFCAIIGSLWAGLAYKAGNGNPFVMATFAIIFMIPMMYRYTQSDHPRSGLVGCITFTFVSLSVFEQGNHSVAEITAARGASMVVGVAASIVVNWILWPFVARHALRKGIASMMFNCSILYKNTMSQYVYYETGNAPTRKDIDASEILEGRLREGFVRLRELLGLTRHEVRLRAPFDPLPYSALISSCEKFFEHVVTVRQSSLFYHPKFVGDDSEATTSLFKYRRDVMAAIVTNLYVLSAALRDETHVPKYLPNALVARKRLLKRMFEVERDFARGKEGYGNRESDHQSRQEVRLGQIHHYSYDHSLAGCVKQVQQLENYTKLIVGQKGYV
ncbi:hypothetical protein GGR50DRAFT_663700 [Xylaria sp. CBS 124048]|nr:hypothetical protein GGR50DRAFT_663700 [Xylaria sp. CBS 124048]